MKFNFRSSRTTPSLNLQCSCPRLWFQASSASQRKVRRKLKNVLKNPLTYKTFKLLEFTVAKNTTTHGHHESQDSIVSCHLLRQLTQQEDLRYSSSFRNQQGIFEKKIPTIICRCQAGLGSILNYIKAKEELVRVTMK